MCLVNVQQRPSPKSTNSRTSYPFLLALPLHCRDNGMCPEMGHVKSTRVKTNWTRWLGSCRVQFATLQATSLGIFLVPQCPWALYLGPAILNLSMPPIVQNENFHIQNHLIYQVVFVLCQHFHLQSFSTMSIMILKDFISCKNTFNSYNRKSIVFIL
jgi:hypothetical protein